MTHTIHPDQKPSDDPLKWEQINQLESMKIPTDKVKACKTEEERRHWIGWNCGLDQAAKYWRDYY